ncbi:MAG: hypothetical protein OEM02_09575 [Desulfobulbaceae bacterium]|nr:hypothetical protein [Desulfobulbaceae bacterium]
MLISNVIDLIVTNELYAISLGIIVALWILSGTTKSFYDNIKKTLWAVTVVWLICFGYHANTGRNIIVFIQHLGSEETPAEQGAFNKYFSHSSVNEDE